MLRDEGALLQQMAAPGSRFLTALRSFRRRGLYANLWGDFMVPFGTAAIEPAWGAGITDEENFRNFLARDEVAIVDEAVLNKRENGVGARLDTQFGADPLRLASDSTV